jgi:hypothetical protein
MLRNLRGGRLELNLPTKKLRSTPAFLYYSINQVLRFRSKKIQGWEYVGFLYGGAAHHHAKEHVGDMPGDFIEHLAVIPYLNAGRS